MKIIFITVSFPFGQGEEFFATEINEWLRRGHKVLIIPRSPIGMIRLLNASRFKPLLNRQPLISLPILNAFTIAVISHPFRFLRIMYHVLCSSKSKSFLKDLSVLPKSIWLAMIALKWKADHIHAYWASTTATMALISSEWSGISWSFTAHRGDIVGANLFQLKAEKALFTRYISQTSVEIADRLRYDPHTEKAVIIHMGINIPRMEDALPKNLSGSPLILCPANLLPVKGHEYLIRAMAILKQKNTDCVLRLAGEGPLRGKLKRLVDDLSLGSIVDFWGHVPHENLLDWYRLGVISIVVLASVDLGKNEHEGIPVSLIEAMSYGIPVISTATGGISELLRGGSGILTPPKDPMALAAAIEKLINDNDLRSSLKLKGRGRIEEEFNAQKAVGRLASLMSGPPLPTASEHVDLGKTEGKLQRFDTVMGDLGLNLQTE